MYIQEPLDFERDAERLFCLKKHPSMMFLLIEISTNADLTPIDVIDRIESYEYLGPSRKEYRMISVTPINVDKLMCLDTADPRSRGECQVEHMESSWTKVEDRIIPAQSVTIKVNEYFMKNEVMNLTPQQLRTVQVLFGGS